ncbi:hypothetical protein [Oleiagrimonas soli]|uniref:Uncharacterized protein n=1 Tax=Oleiagrimonas soli TaxID=1543381 RepID=A0A099CYJ8_9GAMM|nr:hypothetical protein [Oleiagrimonas soli]KGI78090.1 hypothetical protein LF63_0106925 [Oleiagrimonas soli]MBB6183487.1 hypothetical protein [Oleiagrimonas soli]
MSALEKRAWLMILSMCPVYQVYFVIQFVWSERLPTFGDRILCLAVAGTLHALAYGIGLLIVKRGESHAGESPMHDERDRAIDGRATRAAYFLLLAGMLVVGVVMPFGYRVWELVNAALLFVVLSETLRHVLIVAGYRRMRFAH